MSGGGGHYYLIVLSLLLFEVPFSIVCRLLLLYVFDEVGEELSDAKIRTNLAEVLTDRTTHASDVGTEFA